MFETSPTTVPYAKSGKLRALAVTNDKRLSTMPNLPPVAEAGVPRYKLDWVGLLAPAGTPPAILKKLNEHMQKLLASPEVKDHAAVSRHGRRRAGRRRPALPPVRDQKAINEVAAKSGPLKGTTDPYA